MPITSDAVYDELQKKVDKSSVVDSVTDGDLNPVTSNAVYEQLNTHTKKIGTWGILGGAAFGQIGDSGIVDNLGSFIDNEICGQNADGSFGKGGLLAGSINVSGNNTSLGVPDGWYTYLYIPHRNGWSEDSGNDNHLYGTLILFNMTSGSNQNIYYIRRRGGVNYTARVI